MNLHLIGCQFEDQWNFNNPELKLVKTSRNDGNYMTIEFHKWLKTFLYLLLIVTVLVAVVEILEMKSECM